ncbi:hypothetical protein [Nostoc sp. LPT]|nr:hypothetical protein [Nostoc sp. LPT]
MTSIVFPKAIFKGFVTIAFGTAPIAIANCWLAVGSNLLCVCI